MTRYWAGGQSRIQSQPRNFYRGRLSYDLLSGYVGADVLASATIFLCGPLPMMHALTQQFLANGKSPKQIISEEFALR